MCTTVHAIASVRAVENAIGAKPPPNARVLRNLIMAAQCIQDHVIHFYHLHALDWVDVVSALKADPEKTSALAQSISDWPLSSTKYFAGVKNRLKDFVDRGQLGPFANAYWGHPAYKLPPEANLMAVAHYLEALEWQREFIKIHAILGGKNPHLQSFLVGGMATPVDPNRQASINMGSVAQIKELTARAREFVTKVYLPDVLAVASFYKDWAAVGGGVGNYMVYGEYPENDDEKPPLFLPAGIIRDRNLGKVEPLDASKITESVKHSWYEDSAQPLHPRDGETRPKYTGPKPPYERLETAAKYSWLKSPRYGGEPMEVGPLARMLVAYGSGHKRVQELVGTVLKSLGVGPEALFSTLGRIAARCVETVLLVEKIDTWVDALAANMDKGDLRIVDTGKWDPSSWPKEAFGAGFHEAPRGSLGHWVHIKDGVIANYQCIVPSTWNAGPRDGAEKRGPYEAALLKTPVRGPQAAAGDPPHRPLLRPLHGLRGPRGGRGTEGAGASEDAMRAMAAHPPEELPHPAVRGTRIRVYVWDLVVRNTHWVIALAMAILIATGLYIAHPFGFPGTTPGPHFLMGWVRMVHFYAAIVFTLSVVVRIVWFFTSPVALRAVAPVHPRAAVPPARAAQLPSSSTPSSVARPPDVIGHNPLAGLSYLGVFLLYLVMITSGLAMYAADALPGAYMKSFQFLIPIYGSLQMARFIHHLVMWVLILFVTLHVYANALTSALEENGEVDSIFSGYKFVHREDVEKELADEGAAHAGKRRA